MKRLLIAIALLFPLALNAQTAKTRAALNAEADALPTPITRATLLPLIKNVAASSYNPLTDGSLAATYQPLDADLTSIAALTTTAYGRSFLSTADAAAARIILGLGTAATSNTSAFAAATHTHAISDITSLQAALDAKASLSALVGVNAGGVNNGGLVHWSQLMGVPAGFADGSDDGSGGGSGTVTSFSAGDLSPLFTTSEATVTTTPALTFTASTAAQNAVLAGPASGGTGAYSFRALVDADIPAAIARDSEVTAAVAGVTPTSLGLVIGTNVQAFDADLTDLADGSLTGSKVGTGIDAANVTAGTLPLARLSGITNTEISASAGIALSKLATDPLARANHTGTQAISTVTNLQTSLDAKQATLVSGSNIKTINGVSVLGSGDLVVSGGGGGSTAPPLNDGWTTSNTNFVVEGDSIGDAWDDLHTISALTGKTNFYNVAVSGSYIGATDGSGPSGNIFARYNANVYPRRPAANGGTAGITNAILFLVVGTNNNYDLALSRYATYIATAKSHGFTVIACTVYATTGFHASGGPTPYTVQAARWYGEFNRGIYDGTAGAHYVVPLDRIFWGIGDPGIAGDKLHLTTPGNTRAYSLINSILASDGTDYTPSAMLREAGRVVGAQNGAILRADTISDVQIASRAAKGFQITSLTPATDLVWDTSTNQVTKLALTGNVTSITPTNAVAGFEYEIWIRHNGYTVNWTYPFVFPTGMSTTVSSDPTHWDVYTFRYIDSVMAFRDHERGYSFTAPPPPGVLVKESFLQTGAANPGAALHNTQADVVGISGRTWVTQGYSEFNQGILRKFDENRSTGGGQTTYDTDRADNFELKVNDMIFGGDWNTGLVLKAPTGSQTTELSLDATGPNWVLLKFINNGGAYGISCNYFGAGGTGEVFGFESAASLGVASGENFRITVIGGVMRIYNEANTLIKTATLPSSVSAGDVHGLRFSGGGGISDWQFSEITP